MLPKDFPTVDLGDFGEYFPKWGFQKLFPKCKPFWVVQTRIFCVCSWDWTPVMTAHPLPGYGPLNLEAGNEVAGGKGCAGRWMMGVSHSH